MSDKNPAGWSATDQANRGERPDSVLFLCDHNVIRSPMGEALLKMHCGSEIYVQSAGVTTGTPDAFVTAVMQEKNFDLSAHNPKRLVDLDDTWFDLVISFSEAAHQKAQTTQTTRAGDYLYWPAADPTVVQGSREQMLDAYRAVRDSIDKRLMAYFKA